MIFGISRKSTVDGEELGMIPLILRGRSALTIAASVVVLVMAPGPASADLLPHTTVTGTVTDKAGDPLEGVLISDGTHWDVTAPDGTYSVEEPILFGFVLNASRRGLESYSKSAMGIPGTVVDFNLFYTLSVRVDAVSNESLAITVKSFAPTNSCVEWRDSSSGTIVLLTYSGTAPYAGSALGESTWAGSFDPPNSPGTYESNTRLTECSSGTLLAQDFRRDYTIP